MQAESWNASTATKQTGLPGFPLDAEEDESVPRTSLDLLSMCQGNLKIAGVLMHLEVV